MTFGKWLKLFITISKSHDYRDFISNYLAIFTRAMAIIICLFQSVWFIKDIFVLNSTKELANLSFILRNSAWVFIPFVFTKKIPERYKWFPSFLLVWGSAIATLILCNSGFAQNGFSGEGWLTYYLLFFVVSIISYRQLIIWASYITFTIVVMKSSTEYGGSIAYLVPIFRILSTGLILCIGMAAISVFIRSAFIKLYLQENKLQDISKTDTLTGAFNRAKISDLITDKEILHRPGCIFIFDIDKFKSINDTWGHIAGDEAIIFAANALKKSIRQTDILIRYGGDEFIIITDGFVDEEVMWDKIVANLEVPENVYHITFSAGSCRCEKEPLFGAIKKADTAAYNSKFNGRKQLTIFEKLM